MKLIIDDVIFTGKDITNRSTGWGEIKIENLSPEGVWFFDDWGEKRHKKDIEFESIRFDGKFIGCMLTELEDDYAVIH